MSILQLPQEILEIIFGKLLPSRGFLHDENVVCHPSGKLDISNCALVCRLWHLPACRVLYETIVFERRYPVSSCLAIQKKNMGVYCKYLYFYKNYACEDDNPGEYELLLSYLPNVQKIFIESCGSRSMHLRRLALNAKLIKRVKEITPVHSSWHEFGLQDYFDCALVFKETLEDMKLVSLGATISAPEGKTGSIISFLPMFTSLTSLQIKNRRNQSNCPELSMFSVMRSCPNLINFQITTEFEEPKFDTDIRFDHSKMRRLDITVPKITKQHINYICSNITQLDQLYLKASVRFRRSEPPVPIEWMKEIGIGNLKRFQSYLANIKTVEFNIKNMFQSTFIEQWEFIKGVLSNRQASTTHITMVIDDFNENYESETICMKKNGDIVLFCCGLDIREFIEFSNSKSTVQPTFIPPDMTDYNVKSFNVDFVTGDKREANKILSLRLSIFRSIIKRLPSLDYLNLKIRILSKTIYQIKLLSSESLDPATNYRIDNFTETANRRSTTPPSKLDYVLLKYMRSTSEITTILNLLPDTKYLNLFGCKIDQDDNGKLTLDLGDLRLQRLVSNNPRVKLINTGADEPSIVYQSHEEETNKMWKEEDEEYDW